MSLHVDETVLEDDDDANKSDDPMDPKVDDGGKPGDTDFRVIHEKVDDKMDVDDEAPNNEKAGSDSDPAPVPRNSSRLAESTKEKVNFAELMTGTSTKRKRGKGSKGKAVARSMYHDVSGGRRLQRTSQDITVLIEHIEIDDIEVCCVSSTYIHMGKYSLYG